ncbi:hypothetical protein CerSpe_223200 [Prunus speciosa]
MCEALRFLVFMIKSRWFTVFASFMMMACSGGTYLFGTYSKELKLTLGYDQSTLNLLGFFKDLGANIGIFSGLIAEVTPTWFVLLIGAAMNLFGYLMMWLGVTGKIAMPAVWQMCTYIAIGANSQSFVNTGALVTCVKNFPESRAIMLGLLKGYVGLSGAIITQLYLAFYGNDRKALILLVGWLPALIGVIFVYTIRPMKVESKPNDLKVLFYFLFVSIAFALFLMAITLIQESITFSKGTQALTATAVCFLLLFPLFISISEELDNFKLKEHPKPPTQISNVHLEKNPSNQAISAPKTLSISSSSHPRGTPFFSNIFNKPPRGDDYTILQALFSIDMLILLIATLFGLGSSLTAVANFGQIGESLGYKPETIHTFMSLISIWNFFGRVFSGFVSEILLMRDQIPRPLMVTIVLVIATTGYLLIAFPFPGALYIASVIIGFTLGAQLPLVYSIISEIFGLKYYSTLFNFGQLASPLGSYLLTVKVTGMLYDKEARKDLAKLGQTRTQGKDLTCIGTHCFKMAFIILAAVTFFSALVSFILVERTKPFYKGNIYKKLRENAEQVKAEEVEEMASSSFSNGFK